MPYWLETDTFADDEVWGKLANNRADLEDRLQAAYCRMKAKAAQVMSNGYLSEKKALEACRGRRPVLELLCTAVLDKAPLVHRPTDECECLHGDWVEGYEYRIHAFLKRNPARAETLRNRAQDADLKDKRLKLLAYRRDGGCCRYCRSGPLSPKTNRRTKDRRKILHFDHVDPDKPAGPNGEGFVVACARCNEDKASNTPEEAGLVLLREPTEAELAEWAERGPALFDASDWGPEYADIIGASSVRSSSDHPSDHQQHHRGADDASDDPHHDAEHDPADDPGPSVRPDSPGHASDHRAEQPAEGLGSGRVGQPHVRAPDRAATAPRRSHPEAQPVRSSADPDIYHRRSRASPDPGPPEYRWPPGSFRVEPRRREQDPDSTKE